LLANHGNFAPSAHPFSGIARTSESFGIAHSAVLASHSGIQAIVGVIRDGFLTKISEMRGRTRTSGIARGVLETPTAVPARIWAANLGDFAPSSGPIGEARAGISISAVSADASSAVFAGKRIVVTVVFTDFAPETRKSFGTIARVPSIIASRTSTAVQTNVSSLRTVIDEIFAMISGPIGSTSTRIGIKFRLVLASSAVQTNNKSIRANVDVNLAPNSGISVIAETKETRISVIIVANSVTGTRRSGGGIGPLHGTIR